MISLRERIIMDRILSICRNFYEPLLNKSNVTGVGMGYKQVQGEYTNEFCIHVLVKKKVPLTSIPVEEVIPEFYMGHKTDVIQVGNVAEGSVEDTKALLTDRVRPLISGYCIMAGGISTGTIGCVVKKRTKTGYDYFILGNNHILAARNRLSIGAPILQPSIDYGGDPIKDKVATLTKYIPIKDKTWYRTPINYVDCAIAKISNINNISNRLALEGPIMGVSSAGLGETVVKVGMVTGLTSGAVRTIGITTEVESSDGKHVALYKDLIRAEIKNNSGDSGALVVNSKTYAVGLFLASSEKKNAFYCSIDKCLRELDVEIYTG